MQFSPSTATASDAQRDDAIRFNRNELSGAFGDLGTDLPLVVGMILAAGLDAASVLTAFGLMQILTALRYRMPMPVQPLKAMAALVIAQQLPAAMLHGGGLAIGVCMLIISVTGLIEWINRVVPKPVVRGIQCGLGLQLSGIALGDYMQRDGPPGLWLAAVGFLLTLLLIGRKKVPAAVVVIGLGIVYALTFQVDGSTLFQSFGFHLPKWNVPTTSDIWTGFLVLALPQIPLSIGNSVLATRQLAEDLFPARGITAKQIGFTYSLMNLVNPFISGIPVCHGSGGMAGHYTFGGRTGGSVILYGAFYLALGLFFGPGSETVIRVFPMPILGVLLLFEGLALLALLRDLTARRADFVLAVLVGLIASSLPYGYLLGLGVGVLCFHLIRRGAVRLDG
ncbi:MAG: putative sulfate/molybdate transporter [Bryobacterales bacterium]